MKICLINNLYGENARGGAETVVKIIADGLKEKGHEVFVVSLNNFVPLNICLYEDLSKHKMFFRLVWHIFDIFNLDGFFAIRKILKKEKVDIVWTHNLMGLGFLTPLVIKSLQIRHIHTLHDVQLSAPSGLIIKGKEKPVFGQKTYERICRILFGSPAIVVSPSKWLMDFYTEKGFFLKSKRIVLQNPVQNLPSPEVSRNLLNILFLGQVEDHKGIIFSINALKKCQENFVFHIVGDGGKLEYIKKIIEGDRRFIVYGRKTGGDLEEIWKKINLTIVPSLCYENSPTVIFESLNRQIPVLASNIGGIPEILLQVSPVDLRPREFLFETGDEKDFAEKIKWFLENKDRIKINLLTKMLSASDFIDIIMEEIK